MSIKAEVLDAMLAAGCTAEQIVAAVKADQREDEQRRERKRDNNAERQQRFRDKRKTRKGNGSNASNALRDVTPPNDIYSNPPVSHSPNGEHPHDFAEKLVEVWNEGSGAGLPIARRLTGQRLTKLRARRKVFSEAELIEAARNLTKSRFHCGENDRGWAANIGWLLKSDENVSKALEIVETRRANNDSGDYLDQLLAKKARSP